MRQPRIQILLAAGALLGLVAMVSFPFAWRAWVESRYRPHIYTLAQADELEQGKVAVVFGARVYRDGRLSGMLRDRVETAVALYQAGVVQKILVSGDNQSVDYNEPGAMRDYAIARGVPPEDVQPDYGGRRTYDTCYRAQAIFQVDQAVLVTQEFHLPRALFLCRSLGIQAQGVIADRRPYHPRSIAWSENREVPALLVALVDVVRRAPPPVMGEPIPLEVSLQQ